MNNTFAKKSVVAAIISVIFSGLVFADAFDSLAKKLSKGADKLSSKKIAVMPFLQQDGTYSSGSNVISERLITRLASIKGIQVIERSLLDKVLNEMKLQNTGLIDSETTKKIGKVLGVDAVVSGTLIDLQGNETEVNARLINVETGEILSAAVEKVERTWKDAKMLKRAEAAGSETEESISTPDKEEIGRLQNVGKMKPFEMVKTAQDLAKEKKYTEALAYAKQGFRLAQNRKVKVSALFTIGRIHEDLGNTKKAGAAYRLIIRNFPNQTEFVERAKNRLGILNR